MYGERGAGRGQRDGRGQQHASIRKEGGSA